MAHNVLYDEDEELVAMAPVVDPKLAVRDGVKKRDEECSMCGAPIQTMCFKGTGVCGENCHKLRNNQLVIKEVALGAA